MVKKFKVQAAGLEDKVGLLCKLFFEQVSESEIKVLAGLISFSAQNTVTLSAAVTNQLKQELGVSGTLFSTCLHRLEKKGVYLRVDKTINFHKVFKDIEIADQVLITFKTQKNESETSIQENGSK